MLPPSNKLLTPGYSSDESMPGCGANVGACMGGSGVSVDGTRIAFCGSNVSVGAIVEVDSAIVFWGGIVVALGDGPQATKKTTSIDRRKQMYVFIVVYVPK
jgi:hypothetical protein